MCLLSAAPTSLEPTSNNPEVVVVNNPATGQWLALVDGFDVETGTDRFEFRASLDGKVVK